MYTTQVQEVVVWDKNVYASAAYIVNEWIWVWSWRSSDFNVLPQILWWLSWLRSQCIVPVCCYCLRSFWPFFLPFHDTNPIESPISVYSSCVCVASGVWDQSLWRRQLVQTISRQLLLCMTRCALVSFPTLYIYTGHEVCSYLIRCSEDHTRALHLLFTEFCINRAIIEHY